MILFVIYNPIYLSYSLVLLDIISAGLLFENLIINVIVVVSFENLILNAIVGFVLLFEILILNVRVAVLLFENQINVIVMLFTNLILNVRVVVLFENLKINVMAAVLLLTTLILNVILVCPVICSTIYKGSIVLKNRHLIIQERFNKLIYGINYNHKMWHLTACKISASLSFLK